MVNWEKALDTVFRFKDEKVAAGGTRTPEELEKMRALKTRYAGLMLLAVGVMIVIFMLVVVAIFAIY